MANRIVPTLKSVVFVPAPREGNRILRSAEYRLTFHVATAGVEVTYEVPVRHKSHGNQYNHKTIERLESEGRAVLAALGLLPPN